MGPILLVDKSTIQGLSPEEVRTLTRHYSTVVCPILMRELLSNLAKGNDRVETERRLAALAAKAGAPGFHAVVDAQSMAAANLMGHEVPMDGRIPMPGGVAVRTKDGTRGVLFDESEEAIILRRWQAHQFSSDEKELARHIRAIDLNVDLQAIREMIAKQFSHFPKFHSLAELVGWIDNTYLSLTDQRSHIVIVSRSLLQAEEVQSVLDRWEKEGNPLFSHFAPYSHYFYRCNLIYFLGLAQGFINTSWKDKTHLDIQYIYYLPFCMTFTSGDAFLRDIFPFFKRQNQKFLWMDELKTDLRNIKGYWDGLTEEKRKEFRAEYGEYPPDLPGSITAEAWKELMRPRPSKEKRLPKLSKEQEKRLVEQLIAQSSGAVRIEDNASIDPSYTAKYENLGLKERYILLKDKCAEVVGLSSGKAWSDVKKDFSFKDVREIYNWYADLWRPDTNLRKIMAPAPNVFRVLYLGEVDPGSIVRNVLGTLLYFDQVCIVDPFINPWAINEENNPIKHPQQYEEDLLKLVYDLIVLSPWIETDQILFVPDPTDFNQKFKWDLLKTVEKKRERELTSEEKEEMEKMQEAHTVILFRYIWRLSEDSQRHFLKQRSPHLSADEIDAFIEFGKRERARDPIAVDRVFTEKDNAGYMNLSRTGAGYEMSVIICRLLRAVPFTPLVIRMNDYMRAKKHSIGRWKPFCDVLNKHMFRFLYQVDPNLILTLKRENYLMQFRRLFSNLTSRLNSGAFVSDNEIKELTEQLEQVLHATNTEWREIESIIDGLGENIRAFEFSQGHLLLDIEEEGYSSEDVESLWAKYIDGNGSHEKVRLAFRLAP
nr:hypothetical protein [Nitrosomonas nitrosa]